MRVTEVMYNAFVGDEFASFASASGDVGNPGSDTSVSGCGDWANLHDALEGVEEPELYGSGTLIGGDNVNVTMLEAVPGVSAFRAAPPLGPRAGHRPDGPGRRRAPPRPRSCAAAG